MSVKILSHVWEHSKQKGACFLVLLAIADGANDDGFCWIGMPKLSKKARQTPNNTRRYVREIESAGELIVYERKHEDDPTNNHSNLYKVVAPGTSEQTPPDLRGKLKRRQATPPRKNGGTPKTNGSLPPKMTGASPQNHGADPSLDPSLDPSSSLPRFRVWVKHGERYEDGALIDVTAPDFESSANAIFWAWLNALKEQNAKPDTEPVDLWEKNRTAIVGLVKHRRTVEQVEDYIQHAYTDPDDDFWRSPIKVLSLNVVSTNLAAWLKSPPPASKPAGSPARPAPVRPAAPARQRAPGLEIEE